MLDLAWLGMQKCNQSQGDVESSDQWQIWFLKLKLNDSVAQYKQFNELFDMSTPRLLIIA